MTTRFVTLLRGVNVGCANRVPMAEWRGLLEGLGRTGVRTLLNSGNATFTSASRDAATQAEVIRRVLVAGLGVDVPVVVKSAADIAAIQIQNQLQHSATDPSRLLVAFSAEPLAASAVVLNKAQALVAPPEQWQLGKHALYLWCANGISNSPAAAVLLGPAGRTLTTRNWATVLKIAAALDDGGAGR